MITLPVNVPTLSENEWGWPATRIAVLPFPGDTILDGPDGGRGVVTGVEDGDVRFTLENGDLGSLRLSCTCDGLYRFVNGCESDGYRCEITLDGSPGRRIWTICSGQGEAP